MPLPKLELLRGDPLPIVAWLHGRWKLGGLEGVLWVASGSMLAEKGRQVLLLAALVCLDENIPFCFPAPPSSSAWNVAEVRSLVESNQFFVSVFTFLNGTKQTAWHVKMLHVHPPALTQSSLRLQLPRAGPSQDVRRQVLLGCAGNLVERGRRVERWRRLIQLLRAGDVERHLGPPRQIRYRTSRRGIDLLDNGIEDTTKAIYEARLEELRMFFSCRGLSTIENILGKPSRAAASRVATFLRYHASSRRCATAGRTPLSCWRPSSAACSGASPRVRRCHRRRKSSTPRGVS